MDVWIIPFVSQSGSQAISSEQTLLRELFSSEDKSFYSCHSAELLNSRLKICFRRASFPALPFGLSVRVNQPTCLKIKEFCALNQSNLHPWFDWGCERRVKEKRGSSNRKIRPSNILAAFISGSSRVSKIDFTLVPVSLQLFVLMISKTAQCALFVSSRTRNIISNSEPFGHGVNIRILSFCQTHHSNSSSLCHLYTSMLSLSLGKISCRSH